MKLFEVMDREQTMQSRRAKRAEIFLDWLQQQEIPQEYDVDMLKAACLNNASDVPVNQIINVAKDTFHQYIDDPSMARDAGIVG